MKSPSPSIKDRKKKWFLKNELRLRRTQGCLTDCIAYYLNLHPDKVPYFVYPRDGWMERVKKFFNKQGYEAHWIKCGKSPQKGIHIVCGDSLIWKTYAHVVIYKNGKLIYDPDYPTKWNDKRITHRLVIKRL